MDPVDDRAQRELHALEQANRERERAHALEDATRAVSEARSSRAWRDARRDLERLQQQQAYERQRESLQQQIECPGAETAPAESAPVSEPGGRQPRVPTRRKDLVRWRATWRAVEGRVREGRSYVAVSDWVSKSHPDLECSPETLARIVSAGLAGALDD